MNIPAWLESFLRWGLWLSRPKYLVGVFPIVIDDEGRVLLIEKRLGAATGWQLPGGGKEYGVFLQDAACDELEQETGLVAQPYDLEFVHLQCNERHRDLSIAYLVTRWRGELCPKDTLEIAMAAFVPYLDAMELLYLPHWQMLEAAWHRRNALRYRFP